MEMLYVYVLLHIVLSHTQCKLYLTFLILQYLPCLSKIVPTSQVCRCEMAAEISTIKRHCNSMHHTTNLAQHTAQPPQPAQPAQPADDDNVAHIVTRAEIKLTAFPAEQNISFHTIDNLTDLLK